MGAIAWQREMLLKIVAEEDQIITPEDIHYYDEAPKGIAAIKGHGIDLAISQKESADYTTNVSGDVFYAEDKPPYGPATRRRSSSGRSRTTSTSRSMTS